MLGLQAALQFLQQAMATELQNRIEMEDARRDAEEGEQENVANHEEGEEEVEVEDEAQEEENAMLQKTMGKKLLRPERNNPKQEDDAEQMSLVQKRGLSQDKPEKPSGAADVWRPLTSENKQAIVQMVRELMEFQVNMEPSLLLMAMMGEPTGIEGLGNSSSEQEDLAFGQLRPSLLRWLAATPKPHLPRAIRTLLAIPGRTYHNQQGAQEVARKLGQATQHLPPCPLMAAILVAWSDTTDLGVLEYALTLVRGQQMRRRAEDAIHMLRDDRRRAAQPQEGDRQQSTLQQSWARLQGQRRPTTHKMMWPRQTQDSSCSGCRYNGVNYNLPAEEPYWSPSWVAFRKAE